MSKRTIKQNSVQSTIVKFLSTTTDKENLLSSTPKTIKEDEVGINKISDITEIRNNSFNDFHFSNNQNNTIEDSLRIDSIISLDSSNSPSSFKALSNVCQDISRVYYVENSMEERNRIEKESVISSSIQKTANSRKAFVIPDSSDSDEDIKNTRDRLHLHRKWNKMPLGQKEEKQETMSNFDDNIEFSKECFSRNSEISFSKKKEELNDVSNIVSQNIDNLRTPKKHNDKQQNNAIISDSDVDSPHSKSSSNQSPRKKLVKPDIELNLKDLGLNKELNPWIQSIQKSPVMSSIPITKDELLERREELKDLEIEILGKFYFALERIPLSVLGKFPKFDSSSFKKLQDLYRHIKAKTRLIQNKLSRTQKEDEKNVYKSPELLVCSSSSIPETSTRISECNLVNSDKYMSISSTPKSKTIECHRKLSNVIDTHTDEDNSNVEPILAIKPQENTILNKKSTFQLKRPVKTVLNTEVSKTIAEMWGKDQISKTVNSSTDSEYISKSVKDEFNSGMQTPKKNEKNTYKQEDIKNSPDNWINTSTSRDRSYNCQTFSAKVETLTQELERFPVLDNCNIDVDDYEDSVYMPETSNARNNKCNNIKSKSEKHNVESGSFIGDYKNDGVSGEFDGLTYKHSQDMLKIFRQKFGLYKFRPNQLQAINATILGFDCFVLMPTGGGKSLCYQLPSLLSAGLTIVISPLKSLIIDQVQKLISLDIPAAHLSGSITDNQADGIYRELSKREPGLKILYVTPEKISASQKFCSTLTALYERELLARFVIDEAHCVSAWGHDFRPDYKKLKYLRHNYPKVPTMALTATATPRVRTDILHQLGMTKPKWFMSSFNRPNLRYSIITKKGKNCSDEVIAMIKTKFRNVCGIVYCLSRKDCDNYTAQMKKNGIRALSYHAGLTDLQRNNCQGKWISDEINVICATIAFGMGIDKPNVRFVIHAALPKSIEGYYQESGRAGRDGEIADCILFYNYADMHRIRKIIGLDNPSPQVMETHMDNLFKMVAFCENTTDCRRSQQLNYFGEIFNRERCISNKTTACDNCRNKGEITMLDVTEDAKEIMRAVRDINNQRRCNLTLIFLTDIFKGSDIKKIRESGLTTCSLYGRGKSWNKNDIERLLHHMVLEEYLQETMYIRNEISCAYVKIGPKANELMTKKDVKIQIPIRSSNKTTAGVATVSAVTKKVDGTLKELQDRCYTELMTIIRGIAGALDVSASSIMNMVAIRAMSQRLPENEEAMLQIPHVTKANFVKYGKALLDITQKYAAEKTVLLNEDDGKEDNDNNGSWDDDDFSRPTTSRSCGRKRKTGNNYNNTNKKYKRDNTSTRKGKAPAKKSTTKNNPTTAKPIGLASFSQTKQYTAYPNRYMDIR